MAKKKNREKEAVPQPKQSIAKPKFMEQLALWADRYAVQVLIAILLLAFLVRVAALVSLSNSIYYGYLTGDEQVYHNWAMKIANGTFQSSSTYEMAPIPAYLIALVYWLFSPDILYFRIMNIIFGVLTCWLIYLIGKELMSRLAGLAACLIACLYKPFIFYNIVPLKTTLAVMLFALAVWLLVAIINKSSLLKALLLGFATGIVFNVRPNTGILMPFLPLIILWVMYRDKKSFAVMAATVIIYAVGISAVLSPFMIRNYLVTGGKAGAETTTQSGFNLYICNNLEGQYPFPFATTSASQQGVQFTIEASRRVGRKLTAGEASVYWRNEVIKSVLAHPWTYVEKYVGKTIYFLNRVEKEEHYHIGFVSNFVPFFKLPLFAFWLILPLGMAGMLLTARTSRKSLALLSVFFLYASTLIVFFSNARVRLLLLVILIPMAVMGFMELLTYIEKKQFRKGYIFAGIIIIFTIAEFVPPRGGADMTGYYNNHAIKLNSKGLTMEAIQYWEAASSMEGHYSALANNSLAIVYYTKGNKEKALSYLDRIKDTSFNAAYKYETIGDIMVREGQFDRAVDSYKQALAINSGYRLPRIKLIKALEKTNPGRVPEEMEKLKYINSFYNIY
jgi:4-amino-4-deoxy-L-arabinose transferase-like glycosyltransferase